MRHSGSFLRSSVHWCYFLQNHNNIVTVSLSDNCQEENVPKEYFAENVPFNTSANICACKKHVSAKISGKGLFIPRYTFLLPCHTGSYLPIYHLYRFIPFYTLGEIFEISYGKGFQAKIEKAEYIFFWQHNSCRLISQLFNLLYRKKLSTYLYGHTITVYLYKLLSVTYEAIN